MTDIDKVLKKLEPVKEVPKSAKVGKLRHTWKPILEYAIGKGYFRISEDDVSIQSALNGLNKEAKMQNVKVALNTRRINNKVWLYIIVKK
ncbi:MAG: hypothetical protein WAW96_11300 [Alphaproteobacteria bacterium]